MANRWNAQAGTFSTPRATSVLTAMGQGAIDILMRLDITVVGGSGGKTVSDGAKFVSYVERDHNEMAIVLIHELGHGFGLAAPRSVQLYAVEQLAFAANAARRQAGNAAIANGDYYTSDYGGQGPHCKCACAPVPVPSCITVARATYSHDGSANKLCVMFHGTDAQRSPKFCPNCIKHLRGR